MQEYLPQHHLSPGGPCASRARPHDPDRLVPKGRGIVTGAQRPVQGGGEDPGDGVVVLRRRYEHGVVGTDLLFEFAHRFRVSLGLDVGVEVGDAPEVEAVAGHPFRAELVRGAQESAVYGGLP